MPGGAGQPSSFPAMATVQLRPPFLGAPGCIRPVAPWGPQQHFRCGCVLPWMPRLPLQAEPAAQAGLCTPRIAPTLPPQLPLDLIHTGSLDGSVPWSAWQSAQTWLGRGQTRDWFRDNFPDRPLTPWRPLGEIQSRSQDPWPNLAPRPPPAGAGGAQGLCPLAPQQSPNQCLHGSSSGTCISPEGLRNHLPAHLGAENPRLYFCLPAERPLWGKPATASGAFPGSGPLFPEGYPDSWEKPRPQHP